MDRGIQSHQIPKGERGKSPMIDMRARSRLPNLIPTRVFRTRSIEDS
jgi:hypothetical protein